MRFTFLIIILFFGLSSSAQTLENWTEITYQSQARSGDLTEIRITQDSVHFKSGNLRSGNLQKRHTCLKKKEKKHLIKLLIPLNQIDISKLSSPTNKRAYDGAKHSQISVKTAQSQFDHYFDNELPHEKLGPLLTMILKLAEE